MIAQINQTLTSVRAKARLRREEDAPRHERKSGSPDTKAPVTHRSVMLKEALLLLDLKKGEMVVDATLGMAGHSEAMLKEAPIRLLALDADPVAVAHGHDKLKHFGERVAIVNENFRNLGRVLEDAQVSEIHKAFFDLGWNMTQLESGKGFSFLRDEPLSMSYGDTPASGFTAAEILNTWEEKVIADVLFGYGEERYARRIAKAVVERRALKPYATTFELVETIKDAVPALYRHGRLHPATKSFQALRIAVNDELGSVEKGLAAAWEHLAPGGRIVVITFHSIEDRQVKRQFAALAKKEGRLLTKKPLAATRAEITHNPSARSAKMRAIEKQII